MAEHVLALSLLNGPLLTPEGLLALPSALFEREISFKSWRLIVVSRDSLVSWTLA